MSSKRIVIVCTMAAAIAIGIVWNEEKSAAACVDKYKILSKMRLALRRMRKSTIRYMMANHWLTSPPLTMPMYRTSSICKSPN